MRLRAQFLRQIRHFFEERDFLEVETPLLIAQSDPSPHLDSFRTIYRGVGQEKALALHTSPEFAMKRLLALGYPRIFQICKFFRNGEVSTLHNPEFTGLEWYLAQADYHRLMEITEEMVLSLCPEEELIYQGQRIDLSLPWERLTVAEALERFVGFSWPAGFGRAELEEACRQVGLPLSDDDSFDDLFFKLYLTHIEPYLGLDRPTFFLDYPIEMAALARAKPDAPHLAERVELFIGGLELANGYSELNDPLEQRRRFEEEIAFRQQRGDQHLPQPDPGLLNALEWGMPPATGIAVGLDRLLMLLADASTLQDVLPFPFEP